MSTLQDTLIGQMAYIAVKSMLVGGVLSLGVSTVAFGMLEYYPLPPDDASIQPGFLIIEILLRIIHACGSAAVIVSGLTLLTTTFPHNTATVMVRFCIHRCSVS